MATKQSSKLIPGITGIYQFFIHSKLTAGFLLLVCAVIAVLAANMPSLHALHEFWEKEISFGFDGNGVSMSIRHFINDVLMAVFFFSVGLEIKREIMVGELSSTKKAMLPIFAAIGGMLVPALLYMTFNEGTESANGWGIPMATDIAFAIGIISLLGNRCPVALKVFLTALAIVDDIGAIIVLAIFYPSHELHAVFLAGAAVITILLLLINKLGVKSALPYTILGAALFVMVYMSGIHATIAGVILAMTIPAWTSINEVRFSAGMNMLLDDFRKVSNSEVDVLANKQQLEIIGKMSVNSNMISPLLHRLEIQLHPWVNFIIMPLFALANAGVMVDFSVLSGGIPPVMTGVFFGLLFGKPAGIFLFSWLAVKLHIARLPDGTTWKQVLSLGILGGIGFTMSIFIDNLAFEDAILISSGKFAILMTSLIAACAGLTALYLTTGKQNEHSINH